MEVTFQNGHTVMPVLEEPKSIFDDHWAGWYSDNNEYYMIFTSVEEHSNYAMTRASYNAWKNKVGGRPLSDEDGTVTIAGEEVRAMTFEEEMLWNEDKFVGLVDLWGNIYAGEDEAREMKYWEWYCENCI